MIRRVFWVWTGLAVFIAALFRISTTGLGLELPPGQFADMRAPTIAGCFGSDFAGRNNEWSLSRCTFGVEGSIGKLLVVGDSTAASMSDGVIEAARRFNFSVIVFPSQGCSFMVRQPYTYEWCADYYRQAQNLIESLQPNGLVISNYLSRMDIEDRRVPLPSGALPESKNARLNSTIMSFEEGIIETQQSHSKMPILIIHEVPTIQINLKPSLLFNRSREASINKKSPSYLRQREYVDAVNFVVKGFGVISVLDPSIELCSKQSCSARSPKGIFYYMDSYHLNPIGARLLSPKVSEWISSLGDSG